ncbi:E2/UBC family protein [uncultured Enterovirga sp.]|uniref:E2/UBC family protein n=1 Tax=uncultured Enterovirga sp. TaxID=2026352 RepID=UPI0035CB8699
MNAIVERQLAQLRERFGRVEAAVLGSGTILVTVGAVPLPPGWSAAATSVRFLVPPGYPFAALDCFWADAGLTLARGGAPQASGANPIPEVGQGGLWFSWHLTGPWDPNRDTLSSWMNTILDRLRQAA